MRFYVLCAQNVFNIYIILFKGLSFVCLHCLNIANWRLELFRDSKRGSFD